MQMHVVTDSMDNYYGPYANKALAERVLKIVQMAADESAEILSENVDPFSKEIMSGLLPYSVEIMVLDGKVDGNQGCPHLAAQGTPGYLRMHRFLQRVFLLGQIQD
jgi:hypothetical protein